MTTSPVTDTEVTKIEVANTDKSHSPWVLYTLLLGGIVISFSNSALNPAIPIFMQVFNVDLVMGSWVLNAYVMAMSIGLMLSGYLSQKLSLKHLYLIGIAIFTAGSVVGALALNMPMVIIARVIQGFAGGIVIPLSIGVIYRMYPQNQHGRMMALWGIVIMMALAFGPLIGAYLVEKFAWWLLFASTIPLSVIAILLAFWRLPDSHSETTKPFFDAIGFWWLLAWLVSLMLCINYLKSHSIASPTLLLTTLTVGSAVFLISGWFWWRYESRHSSALLNVNLFKNIIYRDSIIISVTQTLGLMLCLLLLPVVIQDIMKQSTLWTGVILMLSTLVASITTHFAGKVVDNHGARKIGMIGIAISAIATLLFVAVMLTRNMWLVLFIMCLRGVGVGLAYLPTTTVGLSSLSNIDVTEGAAVNNISRRIISTIFLVLVTLYIDTRQSYLMLGHDTSFANSAMIQVIQEGFLMVSILLLLTLPCAWRLPKTSSDSLQTTS
ncbi:MFS transporter [Psychrobacter sp. I-STPA6b]|uniref:MFS transporter n=1 Tax=Psychrobacter sp. I-STPA6b TaxID=2585718 RepID=UPI001D0C344E|nr:MFS transporter [Psychrobacter sp. I-STPA6b]